MRRKVEKYDYKDQTGDVMKNETRVLRQELNPHLRRFNAYKKLIIIILIR